MQIDAGSVLLRDEVAADGPFLFELYASTRKEELDSWGWPPEMRKPFLELQFRAQQSYRAAFPRAEFRVLELNRQPIGRIVVDRGQDEIRLVDLALLPKFRNHGIGTALLRALSTEAAAAKKPLRLNVLKGNRAANLYLRLGFSKARETATHDEMEWRGTNTWEPVRHKK